MSDTQARIGRRAEGNRRVGRATAWIAAGCTALAALFGVGFATATSDAQSDTGASTSTGSTTDDDGDSLQAPDSAPEQGSGSAHTGSGGS
ncbi:MAG TPA: hypothetical protein VNO31_04385 [Umezawaea sp.]|nr:hypothetical protein [Umezawaea sp.]